jgi:predicted Zn-dependent protease with MMP-like domain
MDFDTFFRQAHEAFETIPEEFREGVDGLTVRPEALPHPTLPGVFTLGQCVTEAYPSGWTGPETLRSVVALYHGSFLALSKTDPDFDWEGELWETLTHELRHHLESLANEDALEGVDYATEEAYRRAEGEDFDPLYYQAGVEVAPGLFQVEYDFFLEQSWEPEAFGVAEVIGFSWHGAPKRIPRPDVLGDIHYIWIKGLEVGPGSLQLVLLRKRKWRERVRKLGGEGALELWESEARLIR